jgi:hypothetical protein
VGQRHGGNLPIIGFFRFPPVRLLQSISCATFNRDNPSRRNKSGGRRQNRPVRRMSWRNTPNTSPSRTIRDDNRCPAADRAGDLSFSRIDATPSTAAMYIPIPARAQAAAKSFIGVNNSTTFFNDFRQGDADLMARFPGGKAITGLFQQGKEGGMA